MISPPLSWRQTISRLDARSLQSFTCTTERPRSPAGRTLPHPRPWEWEVQSHIREASKRLNPGEHFVVGTDSEGRTAAVAHLIDTPGDGHSTTLVAAGAVHVDARGSGGAVADAMMMECVNRAVEAARVSQSTVAILTGQIHVENVASQFMAERAGLSPVDAPVGPYQTWARAIFL